MARKNKKEMSSYYCVASSNKTGKVVADVIRCTSKSLPKNKYYNELELYLDYFKTKETAEEFARLMTNVIKKSPQGGNLDEDSVINSNRVYQI